MNFFYVLLLFHISYSQFNISPFSKLPSLTNSQQLYFSVIRKNATEVYASIREGSASKIVKWNTTSGTNFTKTGEYVSPVSLNWTYGYVYFFKGYILACATSYKPQLFNETTFEYLGELNVNLTFGRGDFIETKNVFFFGTSTGNVGYFAINTLPNIVPVYLHNSSSTNFVFLQKSLDENYVSVSFMNNSTILIYRTSDWCVVKNFSVSSIGVFTQSWSGDNRYLMIFLYHEIYVLVYDRDSNWALVKNQTIGYKNIRTCFYYEETNIVVAMSEYSSAVILINWYDFTANSYFSINGWKMYRSDTKESMAIFQISQNISWYFAINPFCASDKFYSIPLKNCVKCDPFCSVCNSTNSCKKCMTNYALLNGTCQTCPSKTFYNLQKLTCDNCNENCLKCTSVNFCSECSSGYALMPNGLCESSNLTSNVILSNNSETNTNLSNGTVAEPSEMQSLNSGQKIRDSSLYYITMSLTVQNEVIQLINKVPGSRRLIRQVFAFFMNIDHLWLYIYHKREYGYYVNRLLKAIQNLEQQKWNMISDQFFNQTLSFDLNVILEFLKFKKNMTSWKFVEVEDLSSSFLQNTLDYFLLNIPLVLFTFFAFKTLFHLLFKFQISLLFREYSFNGYLLLMLLEGNYESFSYLFMFDGSSLFSQNIPQKVLNILTLILYVIFVSHLIAGFFLFKVSYEKHAKYFYGNCSNTLKGSICLFVECGLLNFALGSVHLMAQNFYTPQLVMLFSIELLFIIYIVLSIRKSIVHEFKYLQWQNVLASFLRILLMLTYYIDRNGPGVYEPIEQTQMYLIIIYLFNWILSTLISFFLFAKNLLSFILKNLKLPHKTSVMHTSSSTSEFQIMAKRSVPNKQTLKIENLDEGSKEDLQSEFSDTKMKIKIILEGKQRNSEASVVQKIKLYRNRMSSLQRSQQCNSGTKVYNPSSFYIENEVNLRERQNNKTVLVRDSVFKGEIFQRKFNQRNRSSITVPRRTISLEPSQFSDSIFLKSQQNTTLDESQIRGSEQRHGLSKGTYSKKIKIGKKGM